MRKLIILSLALVFIIFFSAISLANGNEFLTDASIYFDSRYYPEFVPYSPEVRSGSGGAEGHSGAYIHLSASVENYSSLENVRIVAEHKDTDFEVTLREAPAECAGVWPFLNDGQYYGVRLKPDNWMLGDWEFTLKAAGGVQETIEATVLRFYYPSQPTGIEIVERRGEPWLTWNSIGNPELQDADHVEYRIVHMLNQTCVDESYAVRPNNSTIDYSLTPGNKIRVRIPEWWQPGDLIRIENRVYGSPEDVIHMGRATRFIHLPMSLFDSP
jgi:hypothetical protein